MGVLSSKKPPKEVIVSSYNENMAHTWGEGKGISIFRRDGDKALELEKEIEIPEGFCWLEGDNEACSIDSNEFGPGKLTCSAKMTN